MKIGGFTSFFNNNLGFKPNGIKRYLKPTEDILDIEKKIASGIKPDELSKEEYIRLNTFEKAESAAFSADVNKEMSLAEKIAIKIAKGEKLTQEEERLISESYPDLRREAEQANKEAQDIKKQLKQAKNPKEKQQIISTAIGNIGSMLSKGLISPIQGKIKLAALDKVVEESESEKKILNEELKYMKIKKGSLIDKEV
ncbi:hypothetical protein [Romboutsia sp.]|uniref:hypothetical protein n=1 Tax=Romboutsia sp. TaxID=1965302 RepID=UPI003F2D49A8